eukprot:TRINITY_DN19834_c0_g1_i1.p1 TRINITY_DN19834_c0_g1~~TRINITY_DN19834_c0_g1_i1.p1  ORF type:complete len:632 (+),score=112.14 TRINITY_DN19834_c0_g1_i1:738-2633(+)
MPLLAASSVRSMVLISESACNAQDLTNTAWAYASFRIMDVPLLDAIAASSIRLSASMLAQDRANTAWAFAKVAYSHEPLFAAISSQSIQRMSQGDPQNIANIVWSFASTKIQDLPLAEAISERALSTIKQFGPQELANLAWSMAQLMFVHAPCLNAIAVKALTGLRDGSTQNLTNTAWAYAQMKFKNLTLFHSLAQEVSRSISEFRERDLSITAWAFARMEVRDENLMGAIADAAVRKISGFEGCTQEIANLTWACALLDLRHKTLLSAIAGAVLRTDMSRFSSQELTNTSWSFAAMKYSNQPLLRAIAAAARAKLPEAASQNVVNLAWSLDFLGFTDSEDAVFATMLQHFLKASTGSLAIEWIGAASIVEDRKLASRIPGFMVEFHNRVLNPALELLSALNGAHSDASKAVAMRELQDWVEKVQAPHLGEAFTKSALRAAGASASSNASAWMQQARASVLQSAWWSCPHAAVSSQGVVAWVATQLEVLGGGKVDEPGRVFFADDSTEHSILVERMLQPIFLQVPRSSHAERRALVAVVRFILKALGASGSGAGGSGGETALQATTGWLKLYASHYLCISCLAVVAQFTRLVPKVDMQVGFDNAWAFWKEREPPTPGCASSDQVLRIGRAM